MRLLIVLILLPFITHGQIVRTHPYYRPTAVSCSYLLDQYSGAAAAYSLRKLDCDYAGSAIRVRRSSDNTESDIGFTSGGDLDTSALKTFVGTSSSDTGYVAKWYSQINSYDVDQSTAGYQPYIIRGGVIERQNNNVCVFFNGTKRLTRASFLHSLSLTSATLFQVTKNVADPPASDPVAGGVIMVGASDNTPSHFPYTDATIYESFGTTVRKAYNPAPSLTNKNLYCVTSASGDFNAYLNNSNIYTTSSNSVAFQNLTFYIGAVFYFSSWWYYNGRVFEILIFDSAFNSSNRNGASNNINTYYSIY